MNWFERLRSRRNQWGPTQGESQIQTAMDIPSRKLSEHERTIVADVREHGWFCTHVFADESGPSFTYTTGFWLNAGMPEIILFGLPGESAHGILWDIFRGARSGQQYPIGVSLEGVIGGGSAVFMPVSADGSGDYLLSSHWFYRGFGFPSMQLVWPDTRNKFPWQPDFEERFRDSQPDLTEDGWTATLVN